MKEEDLRNVESTALFAKSAGFKTVMIDTDVAISLIDRVDMLEGRIKERKEQAKVEQDNPFQAGRFVRGPEGIYQIESVDDWGKLTIRPFEEDGPSISGVSPREYEPCHCDSIGQELQVWDLVEIFPHEEIEIICAIDQAQVKFLSGWETSMGHCTRVDRLSKEEYLPLARRTLDPRLVGDDEVTTMARRLYLANGLIGEWGELSRALYHTGSAEEVLKECGDVLWYASILLDDVKDGEYEPVNMSLVRDWPRLIERVKKEVCHQVGEGTLYGMADDAISSVLRYAPDHGAAVDVVRYQNIKKLLGRYQDGFVVGGGER